MHAVVGGGGDQRRVQYHRVTVDDNHAHGRSLLSCCGGSSYYTSVLTEVSGACEDTVTSFAQVCHAFTLTSQDVQFIRRTRKTHYSHHLIDQVPKKSKSNKLKMKLKW